MPLMRASGQTLWMFTTLFKVMRKNTSITAAVSHGRMARTKLRVGVVSIVIGRSRVEGMGTGFGKSLRSVESRRPRVEGQNAFSFRLSTLITRFQRCQPQIGHAFDVLSLRKHIQRCHATQFKDTRS